ncbi:LysR substrate-binding domain-containing protein [Streptomyces albus]|uniref:LysR substrate-binding domain-containing protein n=1 Tax=Streptomyces albus TaxID=1888 RepID=UPI003700DD04
MPPGTGLRAVLARARAQAGFRPRATFEAAAPPLLAQLAARGLGAAVGPAMPPDSASRLGLRILSPPPSRGPVSASPGVPADRRVPRPVRC